METQGLVMKITDQFMVVMCDDGKFRNLPIPKQIPRVGERITVSIVKKKRFPLTWIASIAALFLFAMSSMIWLPMQSTYAQVIAIDINPSLELYVDSNGLVQEAHARNQDAARLLDQRPVKNLTVQEAIQQVMRQSIADGYIHPSKENLIMVSVVNIKGRAQTAPDEIKTLIRKVLEENRVNGYFKVETASEEVYKTAVKEGTSLNKLILTKQAEQQGINLDSKQNPSESVQQMLEQAGVQPELFFVPVSSQPATSIEPSKNKDLQEMMKQPTEDGHKIVPAAENVKPQSKDLGTTQESGQDFPVNGTLSEQQPAEQENQRQQQSPVNTQPSAAQTDTQSNTQSNTQPTDTQSNTQSSQTGEKVQPAPNSVGETIPPSGSTQDSSGNKFDSSGNSEMNLNP